jgi:hypothetical protein
MIRAEILRRLAACSALLILAACGGDKGPSAPTTGAVAITSTVQTTSDNASFIYSITIDQGPAQMLSATAPVTLVIPGLAVGTHSVTLNGLAAGCTIGSAPSDSRAITIRGGDTVQVAFNVTCVRTTGDIVVTTTTTGITPDPDGYTVLVDGANASTVGINASTTVRSVTPGTHVVQLTGIASNCLAVGSASRTVSTTAGSTATAAFTMSCVAATELRFTVTTSGGEPDPDGYLAFIDDSAPLRVSPNGSVVIRGIPAGTHTIRLRDIADNCALTVPGTRQLSLAEGVPIQSTWSIVCVPRGSGTLGFVSTDPTGDTLPNASQNPTPAIDIVSLSGRYSPGWLILTARFSSPVVSQVPAASNSLFGFIQLDLDESSATGTAPMINTFGGRAEQGVDAMISTDADPSSALLLRGTVSTGRVGVRYLGDSVVISVPLALLDNDDGNMTVTAVFGTGQRPTDLVPNAGVIVARRPAGSTLAGSAELHVSRTQDATVFLQTEWARRHKRVRASAPATWIPGPPYED